MESLSFVTNAERRWRKSTCLVDSQLPAASAMSASILRCGKDDKFLPKPAMTTEPACQGYGAVPADYMFVGISAGRLGALVTRVPFTKDASGRIFQRCLGRLHLSTSDEFSLKPNLVNCYVTNLVKARVLTKSGLNRLPTPKEVETWLPTFRAEVESLKPKLILALGFAEAASFCSNLPPKAFHFEPIFRLNID